jgi:hypothetical protein
MEKIAMESAVLFEHTATFEQGEVTGNVRLGKFEAHYEQIFAEIIEDGVITADERSRLDEAADSMGLDRSRLRQLEIALQAAYEARHRISIREVAEGAGDDEVRPSLSPIEPATDPRTLALQRRIAALESRVTELEAELEEARSHAAVDVDFSDLEPPRSRAAPVGDPAELYRRVRHDPRDIDSLRGLFHAHGQAGDRDRRWAAAHALVYLGAATDEETAAFEEHKGDGLIRPTSSLTGDAWRRLLFHPDEEPLTGDIFGVVVSAVLLGRVAALRHAKALPALDPARKQDPRTSTVQAVRGFVWAASILGMGAPPLYADPAFPGLVEMVPGVPPLSRIGKPALIGRSPQDLAFVAGRHLAYYREERFVRLLLPSIQDLEDIFLAALTIGNPGLPLHGAVKQRVGAVARAIEPILEPAQVDRLRGHFLRFIEDGGRTNLQRWAAAADLTALRAGLLLSNDLRAAHRMLELEQAPELNEKMDDLIVFFTGDRCGKLRKQIGIAIP